MTRRNFNISASGLLALSGIGLTTACAGLSNVVKYLDLGVMALDSALPTILGTGATPITNWANLIAMAFNSATGILQSTSLNTATKVTSIVNSFDAIVLPSINGLSAATTAEINKVVNGVEQFLSTLGVTQPTAHALTPGAYQKHQVTSSVSIALNDTDKTVLTQDQAKLQAIIVATK